MNERQRLANFEVTLFVPRDLSESQLDRVVTLINALDLRTQIENTVLYYLRTRRILQPLTVEVDE